VKINASIFLLLLTFLTAQPLFSSVKPVEKKSCCKKMNISCSKAKHSSDKPVKCDPNRCNPFMACASGNFYTIEKSFFKSYLIITRSKKIIPENDNRLSSCLSDCWHPPESI
jgi:hypothetical protein